MRLRRHPRHRIDASWSDALYALTASGRGAPVEPALADGSMVCLSVRSAFHLFLTAAGWAPGDQVLVSAATHPDMVRIVEAHGLRPVPVDIDPATLAPERDALEAATASARASARASGRASSGRARALVVAHLFGARVDLEPAVAVARAHGLLLVEDCAQSIEGPDDRGDPRATVSLFSFGLIKTATALGGAVAVVRNRDLARRMAVAHRSWPAQSRSAYLGKAVRGMTALALASPLAYGAVCRLVGDPGRLARSNPPADPEAFRAWLERRPSGGLVAMLNRRLRRFPAERLRRRSEAGDQLAADAGLERPGWGVASSHWLFPVVSHDPERLIGVLRTAGFDAARGTSQIGPVPPAPPAAKRMMDGVVFLPAYPELGPCERRRLASLIAHHERVRSG